MVLSLKFEDYVYLFIHTIDSSISLHLHFLFDFICLCLLTRFNKCVILLN